MESSQPETFATQYFSRKQAETNEIVNDIIQYDPNYLKNWTGVKPLKDFEKTHFDNYYKMLWKALTESRTISGEHLEHILVQLVMNGYIGDTVDMQRIWSELGQLGEPIIVTPSLLFSGENIDLTGIEPYGINLPSKARSVTAACMALLVIRRTFKDDAPTQQKYRNFTEKILMPQFSENVLVPQIAIDFTRVASSIRENGHLVLFAKAFAIVVDDKYNNSPYAAALNYTILQCLKFEGLQLYSSCMKAAKKLEITDLEELVKLAYTPDTKQSFIRLSEFIDLKDKLIKEGKGFYWRYARAFEKRYFADIGFIPNMKLCLIFMYLQQGSSATGPYTSFLAVRSGNINVVPLTEAFKQTLNMLIQGRELLKVRESVAGETQKKYLAAYNSHASASLPTFQIQTHQS